MVYYHEHQLALHQDKTMYQLSLEGEQYVQETQHQRVDNARKKKKTPKMTCTNSNVTANASKLREMSSSSQECAQ
jgi:hypothetical protein